MGRFFDFRGRKGSPIKKAPFRRQKPIFRKKRFFRKNMGAFDSHKAPPFEFMHKSSLKPESMELQLSQEKKINVIAIVDTFLEQNENHSYFVFLSGFSKIVCGPCKKQKICFFFTPCDVTQITSIQSLMNSMDP